MNYLQVHDFLFDAIGEMEADYIGLLQIGDDEEALLDFPCDTKEEYTRQTGRDISDEDFKVILVLNTMYNMLYEYDCTLDKINCDY